MMFINELTCLNLNCPSLYSLLRLKASQQSDILMQIVGSKAFYLKTYTTKERCRTQPRERSSSEGQGRLNDIMRIRNLTSHRTQEALMPEARACKQPARYEAKHSTKLQTIQQKEHELLQRICRSKMGESRRHRGRCESVTVERHPIAEVNSLEFESMKPTNRYFQQVDNIRLAERLLLAKPSRDIARISQQKFYQQQEAYRLNIARLSSRPQRDRSLHRKKWVD